MSLLALSACFDNSLPVHTVFIVSDGPGSVSIQKNSFALGASVNFSPEPEEGATCLKSKMYIRAYDNPSSAKIYLNGSSRFIMPDYDVLIYVPFVSVTNTTISISSMTLKKSALTITAMKISSEAEFSDRIPSSG